MENLFEICYLPTNVQEMIYSRLGVDELLSLRRTCKETKAWVETMDETCSISNNDSRTRGQDHWKNLQFIIEECHFFSKSLFEELESKLENNMTNFWIQNPTNEIYELPYFQKFLEGCCSNIHQLKLARFFDCVPEAEWNLFQALTTLEDLELEEVSIFLTKGSNSKFSRMPSCLKNLRSLRFKWGMKITIQGEVVPNFNNSWIYNPLKYCPNLEMLKMPMIFTTLGDECKPMWDWHENTIYEDPVFMKNVVDSLSDSNWSGKLKYVEFESRRFCPFTDNHSGSTLAGPVQELIDLCKVKGVKLINVPTRLCEGINHGECILSVVHWTSNNREFISTDLPNLESLQVDTYPYNESDAVGRVPDLTLRKRWPKLASLSLSLQTPLVSWDNEFEMGISVTDIVRLLVDSEPRPELQNLRLKFVKDRNLQCVTSPSLLRAQSITTNFSNLVNLTLEGWDTTDTEFAHLWEGLSHLETLSIGDCSTASELAFIGKNPNHPSFLKLKGLKKLEMDFSYMPRLTERFFKRILRRMEVNELVLRSSSKYPLNTVRCILTLSKGKVATTLDKITLDLLGLYKLSEDKYIELRNKFRSVR